jgi:hypothetical protein
MSMKQALTERTYDVYHPSYVCLYDEASKNCMLIIMQVSDIFPLVISHYIKFDFISKFMVNFYVFVILNT